MSYRPDHADRKDRHVRWLVALPICVCLAFALAPSGGSAPAPDLKSLHRGKAGIYARINAKEAFADLRVAEAQPARAGRVRPVRPHGVELLHTHPLLDAVVLSVAWSHLEPAPGRFATDDLIREVEAWGRAGKGVVVCPVLYGQNPDDSLTPSWVYQQPGVRGVTFHGGGTAKGQLVRIPAVWDPGFADRFVEPLAGALAGALAGNRHVWYVRPGFGHIGNLTAQPSKEGAPVLLRAGFTPEKWEAYCRRSMAIYRRHFPDTPMLVMASALLVRDRRRDNYRHDLADLVAEFGRDGAAVVHFDLEGERSRVAGAAADLAAVAPLAERGLTRLGLGDDWPLWVPAARRDQEPTRGHDDAYLRRVLDLAFGGVDGVPRLPTTILYCQLPEIQASHPSHRDYHAPVAEALRKARERLLANDRRFFGP